jgi:hypothetical protein
MLRFDTGTTTLDYHDISDDFFAGLLEDIRPHTLTLKAGVEAVWALYQSVLHVVRHGIPGDIVECGVWSGGSVLLAARTLRHLGDTSRRIYLYDTFAGMPKPEPVDTSWDGVPALPTWEQFQRDGRKWGYGGSLGHVRNVVMSSGYPPDRFVFVEGKVEDTIPATHPDSIALLRLDTDFHSSTYHELVHLYPLLSVNGILIIDDYGAFRGAKQATDQYIEQNRLPLFLFRVNSCVRLAIRPADGRRVRQLASARGP